MSFVPESFQKKLTRDNAAAQTLKNNRVENHNQLLKKREQWTIRARKYHQNHADTRRSLIQKRREVF